MWHFGFETSRLRNFSILLWYRFRKKIGIGKSIGISLKRNGIEKSIGINLLLEKFSTIRMACFTQRCILNCSDYSFFKVGATVINTFESWERCLISATNLHGIQKVSPGFQKKCCHLQICNLDIQFLWLCPKHI